MKSLPTVSDPLHDALRQFLRDKRIRGIQRNDKTIVLVTDAATASQLAALGLASTHMGAATRAALSSRPLRLGNDTYRLAWEGNGGLIAAFGGFDKAFQTISEVGVTLVPYDQPVVNETLRGVANSRLLAQRGGTPTVAHQR